MARAFINLLIIFALSWPSVAMENGNCVDKMIAELGVDHEMMSDPVLLNDILKNDLFLDEVPSIREVLGEKLAKPISMAPMLMTIRSALINRHPAVMEFFCVALEQKLVKDIELNRFLHHLFIADDVVQAMARDPRVTEDVYESLIKQFKKFSNSKFDRTAEQLFEDMGGGLAAKGTSSISDAFDRYREIRAQTELSTEAKKKLRENAEETYLVGAAMDWFSGAKKNSSSGHVLSLQKIKEIVVSKDGRINYHVPADWVSLEFAWEFCSHLSMKLPYLALSSLLMPLVIAARPEDYIFHRVLAHWTLFTMSFLAKLSGTATLILDANIELRDAFGAINERFALRYLEKIKGENQYANNLYNSLTNDYANFAAGMDYLLGLNEM